MPNVDQDAGIHSCSYYCINPACILAQRNELRDKIGLMSRRRQAQRIAELEAEIERWVTVAEALQAEVVRAKASPWPTIVYTEAA